MTDISAIISLGLVLLLGAFVCGPWQAICTDFARQIIFEKRDAIFDIANSGRWSFNNREYRIIRANMQKLIRFAHELTLPSLLYFWFFVKPTDSREKPELLRAIDQIIEEQIRSEVTVLVDQALMAAFAMAILKSPIMIVTLTILVPVIVVSVSLRKFAETLFGRSKIVIQFEAERVDALQEAAAA